MLQTSFLLQFLLMQNVRRASEKNAILLFTIIVPKIANIGDIRITAISAFFINEYDIKLKGNIVSNTLYTISMVYLYKVSKKSLTSFLLSLQIWDKKRCIKMCILCICTFFTPRYANTIKNIRTILTFLFFHT